MSTTRAFALLFLASTFSLTACASSGTSADTPTMPMPAGAGERKIGADDLLAITVLDAPELSRSARVATDGQITVPLLGRMRAGGLTTHELEAEIANKLRGKYMVDPQVTVDVTEMRSRSVYVLGAVNQPGAYPVPGTQGVTVLRALAMGEGLKSTAAKGNARIIRTSASGERVEIPVNVGEVLEGRAPDVPLQPDDVLFVPGSSGKSVVSGVLNALVRMVTLRGVF